MKMDVVAGSGNNEYYTPPYAIKPIIKYLKTHNTIWCPSDNEENNYTKMLHEAGHDVIATHIDSGGDFFKIEPPKCDYIISNPPFSLKQQVFQRLFEIGTPFAMLVGVVGLFESQTRFEMFRDNDFELMYFNKRISFFKDYADQKPSFNPPFSSVYVCHHVLPKQIFLEEIRKE